MDYKAKIKEFLFSGIDFLGAYLFFKNVYFLFLHRYFANDEELFWESHPFESSLEKADDLCEIAYTFQRNEIIYKKTSEKGWIAEMLIPDNGEFEIGCELKIENYIYKKIGEKAWTIEKIN